MTTALAVATAVVTAVVTRGRTPCEPFYLPLLQVGIVSGRYDATDPASPLQLLLRDVGPMLKAAARQLADKSPKTRMGMFTVLRTLVGVLPGSVADHVGMLVPGGCYFARLFHVVSGLQHFTQSCSIHAAWMLDAWLLFLNLQDAHGHVHRAAHTGWCTARQCGRPRGLAGARWVPRIHRVDCCC